MGINARNKGTASCLICEQEYERYSKVQKYCSVSCRDKAKYLKPEFAEKRAIRHKIWAGDNVSKRRDYHLRTTFGITLEQYDAMLLEQGGGCAICKQLPKEGRKAHAVDHDHKTGEIYGILCNHCNYRLVGKIRDPDLFVNAAEFLRKGTGLFIPPKKKRRRKTTRKVKA